MQVSAATDPDLTVSMITCDDGRLELEVLHTGPPCHIEYTIDRRWFTRQHAQAASGPTCRMNAETPLVLRICTLIQWLEKGNFRAGGETSCVSLYAYMPSS